MFCQLDSRDNLDEFFDNYNEMVCAIYSADDFYRCYKNIGKRVHNKGEHIYNHD